MATISKALAVRAVLLALSVMAPVVCAATADSPWQRSGIHNYRLFVLGVLALLLILGWNWRLRREVRKRQAAERALHDQLLFQQTLFDGVPQPVYVRDREGRLLGANRSLCEALETSREHLLGKRITELSWLSAADAALYQQRYEDAVREEKTLVSDLRFQVGERAIEAYAWLVPYRNGAGTVAGMIGGWVDVTERYQLLADLRLAKAQADQASLAKSTFLATMSHEIRTPISAVIGMLELALRQADKGVWEREPIQVAYESAHSLLALLGDILDIAKIESGRFTLQAQRANPSQLASAVVAIFSGLARDKQLALELHVQPAVDTDVLIDPLRFKQIVSNLISNAIKFTDHGQVRVELTAEPSEADVLQLQLTVTDTGIGISEAGQQQLFATFTQVHGAEQGARGGSGLGLSICRTLAEMMGGSVSLVSELGQGTQVVVHLVLPRLPSVEIAPEQASEPAETLRPLAVLVVDDHLPNCQLLTRQLGYLGHHTHAAHDGAQALQAWQAGHFDLVITDINMPTLNGFELARAIRSAEQASGQAPCTILGFTANAQREEIERCKLAGMDDCLFKPISLDQLRQRVQGYAPPAAFTLSDLEPLTGGDLGITRELLQGCISANREDLATLLQLHADTDTGGLARQAHKIKSGARLLNDQALVALCENLEAACRQGADREVLTSQVTALEQGIQQLELTLQQHLLVLG